MSKYYRRMSAGISVIADKLMSCLNEPSWGFLPETAYKQALASLQIKSFSVDDQYVFITTHSQLTFVGPTDPKSFLSGKISRKRAKKQLALIGFTQQSGNVTEAHLALVGNLVNRYVSEFSSYPYNEYRTQKLRAGDTFIDVGAFRGYVSMKASLKVGKEGHVFSFEPIAENAQFLRKHIELNKLENVIVSQSAVSTTESDTIEFYQIENQQNSEIPDHLLEDEPTKVVLDNTSITKLVGMLDSKAPRRVVMSLTTNGTELQILEKMLPLLNDKYDYFEVIIPIIFTLKDALDWKSKNEKNSLVVNIQYPWMSVVLVK